MCLRKLRLAPEFGLLRITEERPEQRLDPGPTSKAPILCTVRLPQEMGATSQLGGNCNLVIEEMNPYLDNP